MTLPIVRVGLVLARCATVRLQIFLVVVDPTPRAAFAAAMRANGHAVILFASTDAALAALQTVVPHAVVVDLGTPQLSGLVLAEHLKCSPRTQHVRFIAMTRFASADVTRLALEAGSDDCIELTTPAEVLAARIANLVQGDAS